MLQNNKSTILVFVFMMVLVSGAGCAGQTEAVPEPAQTAVPTQTTTEPTPTAVSTNAFTRIELPTDLRPRGVGDGWYVGTPMSESSLYLVNIGSGERTLISDNGGWGDVVLGETAVFWIDGDGHVQQYDLATAEVSQLTTVAAERLNLVGNERWLVWQDKRDETGDTNYYAADIYAYDLRSNEEIAVAVVAGAQTQPAIFGDTVVWADNRNSPVRGQPLEGCGNCADNPFDIQMANLETGETAVLVADGKHNAQPTISDGRVAWLTFGAGEGIKVLDLETGVVETAVAYQQGMNQPRLVGSQLRYTVSEACDVITLDEAGNEIDFHTGSYLFNLDSQQTTQLTDYKEPTVLHTPTSALIGEGCMLGYTELYLVTGLVQ